MLNLGATEIALVSVVAVVVLGPERLPRAAAELGRVLRNLRGVAQDAKAELRAELGPEVDEIRSLDPRRIIRDQLYGDPTPPPRAPGAATPLGGNATPASPATPTPGAPPPFDADAT